MYLYVNVINVNVNVNVVNVLTYIRRKHTLVGPVKKLNCLNNVFCLFVLVKSYREKRKSLKLT